MVRATVRLAVSLAILLTIVLSVQPSPVPAAATVVQQGPATCRNCSISSANFPQVASGDTIVVGVLFYGGPSDSVSVSDNRGSKFTLVVSDFQTYPVVYEWLFIYVTTVSSSGNELVTINAPKIAPELDLYMYDVSGVSAGQYIPYSSGRGVGYDFHIDNVGFNPGAFLLGIIGTICPETYTSPIVIFPGQGYSLSPYLSPPNPGGQCTSLHAEYSTTGAETPSFTTFSGTIAGTSTTPGWVEVGIVLNSNTSPISISPLTTSTSSQTVSTDWAVVKVWVDPSQPAEGTPVRLGMTMSALSTTGRYPQRVSVQCMINGNSCGSGTITYPGPTEFSFTISADSPWVATPGTHTSSWQIDATNDPNASNNIMSTTFTVQSSSTSETASTTTTQPSTTESSSSQITVVQTETVTQQPTPTTSQAIAQPGILDILQQNSLLLIGALGLLVIVLAVAMMRRGKRGKM